MNIAKWGMAWTALVGVIGFSWIAVGDPYFTNVDESTRATRACVFPAGGWTKLDCSAAEANNSTALNQPSRYILQCVGNSHIAWAASSTVAADANDGYLPGGDWLEFMTTPESDFISCDSSVGQGEDGACFYIECQ